jgi:hypothetical protein
LKDKNMSKDTSRIKKLLGLSSTLPMGSGGGGFFTGFTGHHTHGHVHGAGCGCSHGSDDTPDENPKDKS